MNYRSEKAEPHSPAGSSNPPMPREEVFRGKYR
jgi:hypothetical protein